LFLVEDAAQAHLARFLDKPVGAWGDFAAFSFYPTKNMTTGEGGMATTTNPETDRMLRLLRNQGMEVRYQNEVPGFNNRMTEVAAAIGMVQLMKIQGWTQKRQSNAKYLDANLAGVLVPSVSSKAEHVYHQYTIRVINQHRDEFAGELKKHGVDCDVYYPTPVHELPAYGINLETPVASEVAKSCLSIPIHQNLSKSDLDRIVEAVNKVARMSA
jgi:dTDP-4-amino-4,6-dideoxygalactose transaminase